jgi:hypothetical protein
MVAMSLAALWFASEWIWDNPKSLELLSALSTLILIFGAVVEEWPKLKQIGLLSAKLIVFRCTAFERCVLKKLITHSIGAILVVVGIVGELVFETRMFIVEDSESSTANLEIGRLTLRAGELEKANLELKKQAKDAGDSATDAASAAKEAKEASADAKQLAQSARKEADSFGHDIVSAKEQAAKAEKELADALQRTARLEQLLSWRTVTTEQTEEIKAYLKPFLRNTRIHFRGLKVEFAYNSNDPEGSEYAEDLAKALRNALDSFGVEFEEPEGMVVVNAGPHITGLIMRVHRADDTTGIVLQNALKAAKIDAPATVGQVPETTISFFVGVKPKPTAAKE